jgi:hypothetical protein
MNKKSLLFVSLLLCAFSSAAQQRSTGGAVLRNLVLPGWGHAFAEGKLTPVAQRFLYADLALLLGYAGMSAHARTLEGNLTPYAQQHAGVDIAGRERGFVLAVTNYASLTAYNDEMLRLRQWNALIDANAPQNQWNWTSDAERARFVQLKDRYDRVEQNRPVLITGMVINRMIAMATVYRRQTRTARASLYFAPTGRQTGTATLSVPF